MKASVEFLKTLDQPLVPVIIPVYQTDQQPAHDIVPDQALAAGDQEYILKMLMDIDAKRFAAKTGEVLALSLPSAQPAFLLGLGEKEAFDQAKAESAGGKLFAALSQNQVKNAALLGEDIEQISALIFGFILRSYTFDRYKKTDKPESFTLHYVGYDYEAAQEEYEALLPVQEGVLLARDLVNEAPNTLYPDSYAQLIKEELKPLGVEVEILDEKKMLKLGMGGIMAVGQGSANQPRMVIMRWVGEGADKKSKPLALVGKGVTFDTGGISLKPGAGMDEMKMDMGGSAAVVGAMKAIAARGASAHVVGIVGLAENMPSSNAYRPGDIITTYAGKTVEVLNTDAEGRLVLSDALSYVQEQYDPCAVIDLATLTGAMMVALGNEYCGTFCTHDTLWGKLDTAAQAAQEKLWRMPLDKVWYKEVISSVADVRNMGKSRFAGSCTAAAFLQHFIDEGREWAHMDIAGTAWIKADKPITPKYGTGFAVRTLDQLVSKFYETTNAA